MTLSDVADIVILSVLLHRLLVLVRGTAGQHILAGALILVALQWLARTAGLVLTTWLFSTLGPALLFAFVVIFRNELREALLRTTPSRLLVLGRARPEVEPILGPLSELMFELARSRTGALVVLQNRDRLAAHAREGEPVGGRFSASLLRAVFLKESPLHDGAAVLRGARIDRVGALLPLSIRADLPAEYGTRHRAALGLTERTDAAVVVVSEERGEVSLAHRGAIVSVAKPEELVAALAPIWRRGEPRRPLRRLARDAGRQAAGLLAVTALVALAWWLDPGRQSTIATVEARVEFRNLKEGLALRDPSSETVRVQVKGRRLLVEDLRPDQVRVSVNLGGLGAGANQAVTLSARDLELPPHLEVVTIEPARLDVDIEGQARERVPVRAVLRGGLASGRPVVVARVIPASLEVVGPASEVARLEAVPTVPIDLTRLPDTPGTHRIAVGVELGTDALRAAEGQPERVEVELRIGAGTDPSPPPSVDRHTVPG
jgi:uncharacterized protein (TIGR00159 family)